MAAAAAAAGSTGGGFGGGGGGGDDDGDTAGTTAVACKMRLRGHIDSVLRTQVVIIIYRARGNDGGRTQTHTHTVARAYAKIFFQQKNCKKPSYYAVLSRSV